MAMTEIHVDGRDTMPARSGWRGAGARIPYGAPFEDSLAAAVRGLAREGARSVLVTSSAAGEGKSTVTAVLARALARSGRESVVAVDADPYRPSLQRLFGLPPSRGLGDLIGDVYLADLGEERDGQFGIGDWFETLRAQGRNGDLALSEDGRTCTVRFIHGTAISVRVEQPAARDLLGQRLMDAGHLTAEQCDMVAGLQRGTGRMFGDLAEALGCASREAVTHALHEQTAERLGLLVGFTHPECRFIEMAEPYLPAAGGRAIVEPPTDGIGSLVTGRLRHYLRDPFLSNQLSAYLSDTPARNLKVLTHGLRTRDLLQPAHLTPLKLLVGRLARTADFVLVDAPPVALTTPTVALAAAVDGVILVVRAGTASRSGARRAIEELQRGGARVLGAVLNGVAVDRDETLDPYYRDAMSMH